jgi:hypothetical protein
MQQNLIQEPYSIDRMEDISIQCKTIKYTE